MKSLTAAVVSSALFLAAAPVFGAEEHHAAPISQIIYPAINFLIFVYLLKRFALPPVMAFLRGRRESIVKTVAEAAEEKLRAEAIVLDYRERLARLDHETQKIQSELRAEGERDKARMLREAEELATKIKADANFQVEQDLKAARYRLRGEIARLAREAAESLLRARFTEADEKRLLEEFVGKLGELR
jgi:F-type H+-transporting ATPase subunit b